MIIIWILAGISLAAIAFLLALWLAGPEKLWGSFVKLDTGPIAFETLRPDGRPNAALALPTNWPAAPTALEADLASPVFNRTGEELFSALLAAIDSQPRTEILDQNPEAGTIRALRLSPTMGFPDIIHAQVVGLENGGTSLALYVKARIGYDDLGQNRKLAEAILAELRS
jgi:uncharacterized protein (DUF1499 family)